MIYYHIKHKDSWWFDRYCVYTVDSNEIFHNHAPNWVATFSSRWHAEEWVKTQMAQHTQQNRPVTLVKSEPLSEDAQSLVADYRGTNTP